MKLKTVPKIRTDCISCNGDSSVRIRRIVDEFALPHVDVAVDSEDTAEVELLGWWLLGVPQRKIFGNKEAKIFLCGNKTAVGRPPDGEAYSRSQVAGRTILDVNS